MNCRCIIVPFVDKAIDTVYKADYAISDAYQTGLLIADFNQTEWIEMTGGDCPDCERVKAEDDKS